MRTTILSTFPEDGWLSEETGDSKERLIKKRVWVVDPLDGTIEFIKGIPEFVVSVALTVSSEPVVGVIYNPNTQELFSATAGKHSELNGQAIQCSQKTDPKLSTVYVSRSETHHGLWQPYHDIFKMQIISGSIAYKLANTAASHGDLTVSLRPKNEWDICAGDIIIRNSGGIVLNRNLEPVRYNSENPFVPNGLIAGPVALVENVKQYFKI